LVFTAGFLAAGFEVFAVFFAMVHLILNRVTAA
jgi:hypothetical protein